MTSDEIAELSTAHQDKWELLQVLKTLRPLRPKVVVEIGCASGGSMATWRLAFEPKLLIGIERDHNPKLGAFNVIYGDSRDEQVVNTLSERLERHSSPGIDFLFIDGDHTLPVVRRDWELYSPLVRAGGVIGLHDTNNRGLDHVQVDQFLAELKGAFSFKWSEFLGGPQSPGTVLIWV